MCFLPDNHGPCENSVAQWFYDNRDGVCKQFLYGGCGGNGNRFASRQECEQKCGNVQGIFYVLYTITLKLLYNKLLREWKNVIIQIFCSTEN